MAFGDLFNSFAFGLGMAALFNPCGFALFPAYLGYFVGTNDPDASDHPVLMLNRAQVVGAAMSAGFIAVFGVLGLLLAGVMQRIQGQLAWVTLVMGLGLVVLGVAMLAGYKPMVSMPSMQKGTDSRSTLSMFLFGVSYAVASLSCTIGLFLAAVGTSGTSTTFASRLGGFVSYGAGMALMGMAVTLAVAFGQQQVVGLFRKILPFINLISGVVLMIVGTYVAYYGYWSTDPINIAPGPIDWVERRQAQVADAINQTDGVLGGSFLLINLALVVAGIYIRWSRRQAEQASYEPWDDDPSRNQANEAGYDQANYPPPAYDQQGGRQPNGGYQPGYDQAGAYPPPRYPHPDRPQADYPPPDPSQAEYPPPSHDRQGSHQPNGAQGYPPPNRAHPEHEHQYPPPAPQFQPGRYDPPAPRSQ